MAMDPRMFYRRKTNICEVRDIPDVDHEDFMVSLDSEDEEPVSVTPSSELKKSGILCFTKLADEPQPPKKPLSAYLLFITENRTDILKNHQSHNASEQIKFLAAKWRELSPSIKKTYEERYKQNSEEYTKAQEAYLQSLTEEQKKNIIEAKAERRAKLKAFRLKKMLRELGKPKAPGNAFSLFFRSKSEERGSVRVSEFMKQMAEIWQVLPEKEKQVYHKKAEQDRRRFEHEMAQWQDRLEYEGHIDILEAINKSKLKGGKISKTSESEKTTRNKPKKVETGVKEKKSKSEMAKNS